VSFQPENDENQQLSHEDSDIPEFQTERSNTVY